MPICSWFTFAVIATAGTMRALLGCGTVISELLAVAALRRTVHGQPDGSIASSGTMRAAASELQHLRPLLHIELRSFIGFFAFGYQCQINFISGQSTAQAFAACGPDRLPGAAIGIVVLNIWRQARRSYRWRPSHPSRLRAMLSNTGILISAGTFGDHLAGPMPTATENGYVIGFTLVQIWPGIGNGSVYKMTRRSFRGAQPSSLQISEAERRQWSRSMSGALLIWPGRTAPGGVAPTLALRGPHLTSGTATSAFRPSGKCTRSPRC